jgi:putative PIN family toxin of toxin-antitoxin system
MKIFFDTNVYVAEALLGKTAEEIVAATQRSGWRVFASEYLLDELEQVIVESLGFSKRFAYLSRQRVAARGRLAHPPASRHQVPQDPNDSPILRAALKARVDYLVTNDQHLLALDPYEGLRIVSMAEYFQILINEGIIARKRRRPSK